MRMSLQSTARTDRWSQAASRIKPGERRAVVVAVAAQKGGVGKTTTAVALGSALARFHGRRVLIVDLDAQCQASFALRQVVEVGGGSLSEVLAEKICLEVEEVVTGTRIPNLFVTPGDPELVRAESRMGARIGKETLLRTALQITRTLYDVILLDCPPNVGTMTINGLAAADQVLIPCNASALSVAGVGGLLEAVHEVQSQLNPRLQVLGMVLTRVDPRTSRTNRAVFELIDASYKDILLPVQIPVSNTISAAQLEGRDLFDLEPEGRASDSYKALAQCIVSRWEDPDRKV